MKTWLPIVAIFLLAYIVGSWLKPASDDNAALIISDCDPDHDTCQLNLDGQLVSFGFTGTPSPLKPFGVELVAQQASIDSASVSFEMQGMDMGYHQHALIRQQNNWSAQLILPVCSLGRNDWIVKLKIKAADKTFIHQFGFVQKQDQSF